MGTKAVATKRRFEGKKPIVLQYVFNQFEHTQCNGMLQSFGTKQRHDIKLYSRLKIQNQNKQ
jgi:hypothetical protein